MNARQPSQLCPFEVEVEWDRPSEATIAPHRLVTRPNKPLQVEVELLARPDGPPPQVEVESASISSQVELGGDSCDAMWGGMWCSAGVSSPELR